MKQEDPRPITDYQLERYLLRELPAAELTSLQREISADPALQERLGVLERSNEELHQRFPPEWMIGQIELKRRGSEQRQTQRQWSGYRLWAVPAAALLLAVVVVPALFKPVVEQPQSRIKGGEEGPRLMIFRKLTSGEERLQNGALARSGDLVQLIYRSGGLQFGAIFSVDGRGAVTQHLPLGGATAVSLVARDTLDFAYELDDAPRWERFVFVAANYRFDLKAIAEQLAQGAGVDTTAGLSLFEFTLNKSPTP